MNVIRFGRSLAVAALFAAALQVHAQESGSASSATDAMSSGAGLSASASAGVGVGVSSKSADRALRRRVLNALAKSKGLRTSGITVRAKDGAVVLEGWVPEVAQIEQATRVAQTVPGVTAVKNTLTLSTF
jgi:hyperosmotically inducible periplasmic protein